MKREAVAPSNHADREIVLREGGSRERLAFDPENGAETFLLTIDVGRKNDRDALFEYHTCHEENFLLRGTADFAGWYGWESLGYLMHPPYWWHPAGYRFPSGAEILIKLDAPVDFTFREIPSDWDRREWIAPESPHWCKNRAVSNANLESEPWELVLDTNGQPAGFAAKHLWDDVETGWTTWLMRTPAGWRGSGEIFAGGDELYLLSGDLNLDGSRLLEGGYYYEPDRLRDDGASEAGFTAIRWTRGDPWRLPPIRIC
ncbi:MAG: hypothetical protein U0556_12620 [Dehalococcoidia bacterium]